MKDRFDLENEITELHNFAQRLSDLSYGVVELNTTTDETANALDGLSVLLKIHAEKMFDTFTQAFKLDGYANDLEGN
jgi:hypothetical protein